MKKIRHTGLTVTNLDLALAFYRDVLGLRTVKDFEEEGDYIDTLSGFGGIKLRMVKLVADDGSMVELLQYLSHPSATICHRRLCDVGTFHIAFEVDSIDETYTKLTDKGVSFISTPQMSPDGYARVAFCHDPDGNSIELVQVL